MNQDYGRLANPDAPISSDLIDAGGGARLCKWAEMAGEAALPVLDRLLGEPLLAGAAVEALGHVRQVGAADRLAALANSPNKPVAKTARRSLVRLKSFGIVPSMSVRPVDYGDRIESVAVSHFDGAGRRVVRFLLRRKFGAFGRVLILEDGWRGLESMVTPSTGDMFGPGRKSLDWLENDRLKFIEVPVAYGKRLAREAMTRNGATGLPVPIEAADYPDFFGGGERDDESRIIYRELSQAEVRLNPTYLEESALLFDEPEMMDWWLEGEQVTQFEHEMDRARAGGILFGAVSHEQRLLAALRKAHDALLTPEVRSVYQRLLEEQAYYFFRSQRPRQAKMAIAAAVAMGDAPRRSGILALTARQGTSPFSLELIARSLRDEDEDLLSNEDGDSGPISTLWFPR